MHINRLKNHCDAVLSELRVWAHAICPIAQDRDGATIIEYGMLAGLVGLAAFAGFLVTGTAVAGMFDSISIVFNTSLQGSP